MPACIHPTVAGSRFKSEHTQFSLTIARRIVRATDSGAATVSPTRTILEADPNVTVIVPHRIWYEAVYCFPSAFKTTWPAELSTPIASFSVRAWNWSLACSAIRSTTR
jgi:hypothetical protein